ncbi:bifunctional 2',3'-cyclic-nucleotide 2'-phosphodiesterase/3'-nucleotidase [Rhodospirillum centenum]|uniref:2',3'-cyclic-nucleotide 2'-phosphodiesterase n=1 Tax=Rhodospirillum centenum (strain ATCC 51521 / SW) TaxID=414684 RepID=B6IQG5_RHOCS|nr:bifunctional 2',3'-cyclic-nucleotide 2'-phosphodiesterase/3'-nucleotidase [Rhodospirillum centenum]ACI97701.1 2',3'-cyclic-nucleotide 2'-phosphodiesterase [Rhodospirillum centenum SW]
MIRALGRRRPFAGLALLAALVLVPLLPARAEDRIELQVLTTTDLHMALMDYDYYADRQDPSIGLVRVASLIRAARAANPNTLLLDNGDLIQGTPLGDWVVRERGIGPGRPHPAMVALNHLGYDAAVLGNHEFNFGLDVLKQTYAAAAFPVLAGNVFVVDGDDDPANDRPLYPGYTILERQLRDTAGAMHTVRIGVIGVLTPQIMVWDRDKLDGKVTTRDIVDTARRLVPEVRAAGADIVIALSHAGLSGAPRVGGEEQASAYLTEIPGIDAVVTGHSHGVFPGPDYAGLPGADLTKGTVNGVPLVMAGYSGNQLGVIELTLEQRDGRWTVADGRGSTRPLTERRDGRNVPAAEPDAGLAALLATDHQGTLAYVRRAVGRTSGPIHSYCAFVGDTPGLELISEAERFYMERALRGTPHAGLPILAAAAVFKSGGRFGPDFYADIPAGEIAIRNIADIYPYPNMLVAVKVTGAQVREWLEMSARVFNRIDPADAKPQMLLDRRVPGYNFDVIDGVTYAVDLTQPPRYDRDGKLAAPDAHRIRDLSFQGKPIDEAQEFIVVTNNYRANGGGSFPGLDGSTVVFQAPETAQEAILDYIRTQGVVEPRTDSTFRFQPVTAPVTVLYDSSPRTRQHLAECPTLTYHGPGENGFDLFRVDLSGKGTRP